MQVKCSGGRIASLGVRSRTGFDFAISQQRRRQGVNNSLRRAADRGHHETANQENSGHQQQNAAEDFVDGAFRSNHRRQAKKTSAQAKQKQNYSHRRPPSSVEVASVAPTKSPHYLLEEPTTGLYLFFAPHRVQLSAAPNATRFTTAGDAILASARIADQPHELVRVDGV